MRNDLFANPVLGRSYRQNVSCGILDGIHGPAVRWFSSGKSKSKSSSEQGTKWNDEFMKSLEENSPGITYSNDQNGVTVGGPDNKDFTIGVPKFQGLEDMDFAKLEKGLYDRQIQNIDPQYQAARGQTREELSQSGLLNSPVQYSEGGAIDRLQQNYLQQTQRAASDASNKTIDLKQQELARKTGWDIDTVKLFQTILQQYADVALKAGQFGQSSGSSSGSSMGITGPSIGFNFG